MGIEKYDELARLVNEARIEYEQFKGGKEGILGFLVGQVMKASGGSANPKVVSELLRQRLSDG